MKLGDSWNVQGVRARARDTAREAARRSGISVGEWLNELIIERAAEQGIHGDADQPALEAIISINERLVEAMERLDRRLDNLSSPKNSARPDETRIVLESIDRLDRRLDQLAAERDAAMALPRTSETAVLAQTIERLEGKLIELLQRQEQRQDTPVAQTENNQLAQILQRLDARLEQIVNQNDAAPRAGAPARQSPAFAPAHAPAIEPSAHRAREVRAAATPAAAEPKPTAPITQPPTDKAWLSEIDRAFAEITQRQRALENDAAEIAPASYQAPQFGRQAYVHETMPREDTRAPMQVPVERPAWAQPAPDLSGLENQLRHITAQIEQLNQSSVIEEALNGLRRDLSDVTRTLTEAMPRQAIQALENEMRNIAQRLTQSHHQSGVDLSTVTELGKGLMELRDTLRMLTPLENLAGFDDAVRGLAHKIDAIAVNPDPTTLQQLDSAVTSLRGLVSNVASDEALAKLADEMSRLSARVEQVAKTASERLSPQIEEQLRSFSEQLRQAQQGQSNAGLGQLQEHIASLSAKLEASDERLNNLDGIERSLRDVTAQLQELRGNMAVAPVAKIERDISRTRDTLEDVHGTIDHVVDRIAAIETDMREARPAPRQPAPVAPKAAPKIQPEPRERRPIDPTLPPDTPLEPGAAARETSSAAARIAASEMALGRPAAPQTDASTTNFIAAARRAAQAASPAAAAKAGEADDAEKPAKTLTQRMRSLLAGASVVLILVAGARIAMTMLESGPAENPHAASSSTGGKGKSAEATQSVAKPAAQTAAPSPILLAPPETTNPANPTAVAVQPSSPAPAPEKKPVASLSLAPEVTGSLSPTPLAGQPVEAIPTVGAPSDKFPIALRNAASAGNPAAQYEVATRYLDGNGVPVSLEQGALWLERAAKAGLAPAQFRLGSLYEKGQGVKKNLDTARALYAAAADKGNAKAMHNIAVLYAEGLGGKPDYKSAALWFRKAADYGVSDSQYNLAILYARGIGVAQNLAESYKWFALAAAQGDKEAGKKRDDVAARLDADTLASAKAATTGFRPEIQPEDATMVKAPQGGWERQAEDSKKRPRAAPVKVGGL